MRRTLISLAAACSLVLAGGIASADPVAVPLVPAPSGAFASANVTHIGNIPLDGVGVSMRTVKVGKQVRAFVSSATGLTIYDATNPAAPSLLGHLAIYNFENEDIAVSDDGRTAILTEFTDTAYLYVVDVSDPNLPKISGQIVGDASHTAQCADRKCNYLYGSNGVTYDITNRAKPVRAPAERWWGNQTGVRGAHALHRDAAGVWVVDSSPLVVFRQTPDALHLTTLTRGTITEDTGTQHNNIRPRAERYKPRPAGDAFSGPLRPGELLLSEGETGLTQFDSPTCNNSSGAFSTWSMVGFDQGYPMQQLDVLRPFTGTDYMNGNPRVSQLSCSGHWFTQKDARDGSILVAAAWYAHGTRFLKVNPKTGKIRQVGFYQPVRGEASSSYWMSGAGGDYVWTIDYHSGIDIMKFDQAKAAASPAQTQASWAAKTGQVDTFSNLIRQLCRQNGVATPAQRRALDRALLAHHG